MQCSTRVARLERPGCPHGLRSHPQNLIRLMPAKGARCRIPRCLTIATSDSGGGAGIQADLKAFASLGCHGMSAVVALTAQNTTEVRSIHEAPPEFIRAQLATIWDDIGVDAAKTGMLFSAEIVETVAAFLETHPVRARRRSGDGRGLRRPAPARRRGRRARRAAASSRDRRDAEPARGVRARRRPLLARRANREELAKRIHALGPGAVIVTGGHGEEAVDWLFDGERHVPISGRALRRRDDARRGLHALGRADRAPRPRRLPRGRGPRQPPRSRPRRSASGYRVGAGSGPVDVFGLAALRS